MDYLHHELARLDCVYNVLSERLCLHRVGKLLCHLVVDIGVKQRAAHILQRFGYVNFGNFALTLE